MHLPALPAFKEHTLTGINAKKKKYGKKSLNFFYKHLHLAVNIKVFITNLHRELNMAKGKSHVSNKTV